MSEKNEEQVAEELLDRGEEGNEEEAEEQEQAAPGQEQRPQSVLPQPLGELKDAGQLSKDEIAYGCTFFSNAHGYSNPLNVITPKAL